MKEDEITSIVGDRCPSCGSPNFAWADEQRGLCFDTRCGLRTFNPTDAAARVFETIYRQCHLAMVAKGAASPVLAHSLTGIVPADFDTESLWIGPIADAAQHLDDLKPEGRGRPTKELQEQIAAAEAQLRQLQQLKVESAKAFEGAENQAVYFWTASNHHIVRMTLTMPGGEERCIGAGGLFTHGLRAPANPARGTAKLRGLLLVVPTPADVLAVQGAGAACAAIEDLPPERGYIWCAAIGTSAGAAAVRELTRKPVLLMPDTPAWDAVVSAVRQHANLHLFYPPGAGTVADWLAQSQDAWGALEARFLTRTLLTRPFAGVRDDIDEVRNMEGSVKKFEVERWVGESIARDLSERGRLYFDGQMAYVYLHDTKDVTPIDLDQDSWRRLANHYGVAPTDSLAKPLAVHLTMAAADTGTRAEVYPFVHYDRDRNAIYLFNLDKTVYRITADRIEAVDNGTDGKLFVRNDKWTPFELDLNAEQFPDVVFRLIGSVQFVEGQLHHHEVGHLFRLQLLAMFVPELFPTRPILAMIGPKGSGKTSSLELLGTFLFGPAFKVADLTEDARDFDASLTSEFFVVADNADREIKWLADKLAVVATGGTIKRRAYYTTNKQIEFPLKAWLAITSRTPHFRREDVADRLLPFHVQRFEGFAALSDLKADIVRDRNLLMTALVRDLQKVLRGLAQHKGERIESAFRMADYGQFAIKVSEALGFAGDMQNLLARVTREQTAFAMANEPLFEWLDKWVALPGNAGKLLTTGQLYAELRILTLAGGDLVCPWETPQAFGRVIDDFRSTLDTLYGMKERPGRSGTKLVQFWPANTGDLRGAEAA